MNRRMLFMIAFLSSTGAAFSIAACASNESNGAASGDGENVIGASASDGSAAADTDMSEAAADAGPCTDCEWFPADCAPNIPCSNGPFDPSTVGGAIDGRLLIHVIRGRSASDVWALGALGAVAHFDGTSWTRLEVADRSATKAIWLREDTELLLTSLQLFHSPAADGGVASWDRIELSEVPTPLALTPYALTSAWAAEGATWMWCTTIDATNRPASATLPGLWRLRYTTEKAQGLEVAEGLSQDACGATPCLQMNGVHGQGKNELWAVGSMGATVRVTDADSDTPQALAFNSQTLNDLRAVWTASATEAWSVGAHGTIRHYVGDPVRWDVVADVPVSSDLNAVWGASPSDVWAVGDDSVVLHYDGVRWSRVPVGGVGVYRPKLTTVWSPSPGHVWIGGDGFVLSLGGRP